MLEKFKSKQKGKFAITSFEKSWRVVVGWESHHMKSINLTLIINYLIILENVWLKSRLYATIKRKIKWGLILYHYIWVYENYVSKLIFHFNWLFFFFKVYIHGEEPNKNISRRSILGITWNEFLLKMTLMNKERQRLKDFANS